MNKLSQTLTFQRISKALPSLKEQLNPANFPKYTIPINYYDSYFNIIGVKKYPLVQPTIKAAKAGKIRLLNHSDPYNYRAGQNTGLLLLRRYLSLQARCQGL